MRHYKILGKKKYTYRNLELTPIRDQDMYSIMKWRNEQIYHLRQSKLLTKVDQETYFKMVIAELFLKENPDQILFSVLEHGECVAYGGLVHINWQDKNAEVSFVLDTKLENDFFEYYWAGFLKMIEEVAFMDLMFHKIFTYAFDIRPLLYKVLEANKFTREATLNEHCFYKGNYIDVVIHSKISKLDNILFREANFDDMQLIFEWANDPSVRQAALNSDEILWDNHQEWFMSKMEDPNVFIYIFYTPVENVGQVRIEKNEDEWCIDYSVDKKHRGNTIGYYMLKKVIEFNPTKSFIATVKADNIPSVQIFEKLGFNEDSVIKSNNLKTFKYECHKRENNNIIC